MSNREILDLPGFSAQSIWGYDEMIGSYYAQIWDDASTSGEPGVWISGMQPVTTITELVYMIAARLGLDPNYVDECMSADRSTLDDAEFERPSLWQRLFRRAH